MPAGRRAKVKKYNKQTTFNIEQKLHDDILDVCDKFTISISEFIRESIRKNVDYYNSKIESK